MWKVTIQVILGLGALATAIWAYFEFKAESVGAALTTLAGFISSFFFDSKKKESLSQKQYSGKKSKNYQAGNDINIK